MTILYVREQGAVVRRDVEQIQVTITDKVARRTKVLQGTPVREVEQVVLYGNVQLTTQAAALLLQHDVDVVFFSLTGVFRGRLSKGGGKFARLRHAQLKYSSDDKRSLATAKQIVRSKLANQRNLLQRLASQLSGKLADDVQRAWPGIEQMRQGCSAAGDPDQLRGYEGKGGVYYFGALRLLLGESWAFDGRKYYPPPDPFNALLSFGYALLQKDVTAAIEVVGLDPYLGCLHALEYGRPSLVLDLMEEFRPVIVDQVMLNLALSGKIKAKEFVFTGREQRPVELGPELIPTVIKAYEDRVNSAVEHSGSENRQTLRRCIELQARIFARTVLGSRHEYEGLVV